MNGYHTVNLKKTVKLYLYRTDGTSLHAEGARTDGRGRVALHEASVLYKL